MTEETQAPASGKPLVRGCSEPGCRVPGQMATFHDAAGQAWCISHVATVAGQAAKQLAVTKGALVSRRPLALPDAAPTPDWQTRESIVAWAEDTADRVLKGKLDPRYADSAGRLAALALAAHDLAARDLLDTVRKLVPVRARRL